MVVVRLPALDSYTVSGYVLRDWKRKINTTSKDELDDVDVFLKDLRHHVRKQDYGKTFFDALDNLNVGPVRALASGSCAAQDLDAIVQTYLDKTYGASSWREFFDEVDNEALI